VKCFKLVFVQNNLLCDDDIDDDGESYQQSVHEKICKPTSDRDLDEDEVVQFQHD
jgi:hypothetical protein